MLLAVDQADTAINSQQPLLHVCMQSLKLTRSVNSTGNEIDIYRYSVFTFAKKKNKKNKKIEITSAGQRFKVMKKVSEM